MCSEVYQNINFKTRFLTHISDCITESRSLKCRSVSIRKVHENELRELESTLYRITPYRMFMIAMYGISKVCYDELRY